MRYVVDENNYVKAISFGTIMEYNECVCVEYTGSVPSGWNDLEAWYFDEGNKLWRWQIIDRELVMDESATAPEEGSWMGIVVSEPSISVADGELGSITFDLPEGTKTLVGFFVLLNNQRRTFTYDDRPYCVAIRVSVADNIQDVIAAGGYSRGYAALESASGGFVLDENSVTVRTNVDVGDDGLCMWIKDAEYALYPFYSR